MRRPLVPQSFSALVFVLLGILLSGLLRTGTVQSQDQKGPEGTLTGQVFDAESGDPLIRATVALWDYAGGFSHLPVHVWKYA